MNSSQKSKNAEQIVYLNGAFMPISEAKIPVLDRGFIFGDSIYEVIPVFFRQPFRLEAHLKRLNDSLKGVGIDNPKTVDDWSFLIEALVARSDYEHQAVYLQVTRGVAPRDHTFPVGVPPTVFMMTNPLKSPSRADVENGVACVTAADNRWLRCNLKTTSLIGNVLLHQLAVDQNALETILFRDDYLTEASSANVIVVKNGVVLSPPLDHLILPGTSLAATLEFAGALGLPVEERPIRKSEVLLADELWLTSSGKEVLAVTKLDGKPVGNGKVGEVFNKVWNFYQSQKPKPRKLRA
ncbi:MAG: D-amino acid aminotransferase [Burkholderiales bacterium]|jgi:D-alanine transaminase|nr:D-amino acid aminotransferase [Burkholderiales bacterium]